MQKMINENIIIEVDNKNVSKAEELGFIKYSGVKIVNAEVDFNE